MSSGENPTNEPVTYDDVNEKMKILGIKGYDAFGEWTPADHMRSLDQFIDMRNRRVLRCLEEDEQQSN